MLYDITFIDESGLRVTLPVECDPQLFEKFRRAFDKVAKCIPLKQREVLAARLKETVPDFRIVVEDKLFLVSEEGGKRQTAMGLVEPHIASIRFAGKIVAEMSDKQVEELIAHELGHAVMYAEERTGNLSDEFLDEFIELGGMAATPDAITYLNEKYATKHAEEWGFPQSDLTDFLTSYAKRHGLEPISQAN